MTTRILCLICFVLGAWAMATICKRPHPAPKPETDYWEKKLDNLNSIYEEEKKSQRLRK